jgi:hypothetical protein
MTTPLTDLLPARVRRVLYIVWALAGLGLGVCQILGIETGKAADVLTYLGTGLGLLAASNAPSADGRP